MIETKSSANRYLIISQVIEITEYRSQLYDYLRSRMMAVAPNLTVLLGEFVGARLVAQAGEHYLDGFKLAILSKVADI